MARMIRAAVVALGIVAATTAVAWAQPKPWAAGVSDQEQSVALEIFRRGNAEFEEERFAQALALYRQAIKHWDHPAIRFNMGVCHVNLDQPLEAYTAFELALKYGAAPLAGAKDEQKMKYGQALMYKQQLLTELATLDVTLAESDATVTLDGAIVLTAPGKITKVVRPGAHQIVATKPGFLTTTLPLVLVGGKTMVADVKLARLAASRVVRRWAAWKPWTVFGAGAAVALGGGYLELRSYDNYKTYDERFATMCPNGCGGPSQPPIPEGLTSLRDRAAIENGAAIALFAVGGLALVAGAVGVYLNQPMATTEDRITIAPLVRPGSAGLVVSRAF
jgi:tetratricopeptide (TPR) repeat protein